MKSRKIPFRVGFVLLADFPLLSYASASEPLRAANLLSGELLYDIRNIPISGARSVSSSGAIVGADAYLGEQVDFDLVLVVAGSEWVSMRFARLEIWLRLLASRAVLIGGVSAGPLVLARAGIMEGRRMTVHWDHSGLLASLSQRYFVERSLYVRDRDRLTCAGGTAALDMMHALIAEHHGPEFARKVSDWFLHTAVRAGEDEQLASLAQRYDHCNETVLKAIEAMENHIADPLELSQLASLSGLSTRHLNRVFRQQFDRTTLQFYRQLRLSKARSLLKRRSLSINDVAVATGFANGAHLSRHFSEYYQLAPTRYRASLQEID